MKNFKSILLFLTVFVSILYSQNDSGFSDALELYQSNHFIEARERFLDISLKHDIDENLTVSSKYYAADCLLKLGNLNGTIEEFENFITKYRFSNFSSGFSPK